MGELAFVKFADGGVHLFQQLRALVGDSRSPRAGLLSAAHGDPVRLSIRSSGRIMSGRGSHALSDSVAGKTLGARAAQDAERCVGGVSPLAFISWSAAVKRIGGLQQDDESGLLRVAPGQLAFVREVMCEIVV